MRESFDYLIVGAGFSGLVLAERLGAAGHRCLVVERRDHIGGNCHDRRDRHGMLYHAYGPHYFRTNVVKVRDYLSRFTTWRPVDYRVKVQTHGRLWSFPINLATYRQLCERPDATEAEFKTYLTHHVPANVAPANARDAIIASVGEELYALFYAGYTRKHWGRPPESLEASVTRRIPIRTDLDDRYFHDAFQALPADGYHTLFQNLLTASGAELRLNTDFRDVRATVDAGHIIYTGPLDAYFDHRYGPLPYRTLDFQLEEHADVSAFGGFRQAALQINHPGPEPFTRTVELKHVSGQGGPATNVMVEFSREARPGVDDPYYPIPGAESHTLAARYRALADAEPNVTFTGRLAEYRYLNMDQVVAASLHLAETRFGAPPPAPATVRLTND